MNKIKPLVALILLLLAGTSASQGNTEKVAANAFFFGYLNACPAGEVRCLWFLSHYKIGMVMAIDLEKKNVYSAREVYDHATQCAEINKLDDTAVQAIKTIIQNLPPSSEVEDPIEGIYIAHRSGEKVEISRYKRANVPAEISKLYKAGGGYLTAIVPAGQSSGNKEKAPAK